MAFIMFLAIFGPMFFGAAQNALKTLLTIRKEIRVVILDMSDVPMIDMTAMVALQSIIKNLAHQGIALVICGMSADVKVKLKRANILTPGFVHLKRSIAGSVALAGELLAPPAADSPPVSPTES